MGLIFSLPGGIVSRGGVPKLRNRRVPPPPVRRRGQGVITGLAARRPAALLKRVGTFNRAAANQVMEECSPSQTCVPGRSRICIWSAGNTVFTQWLCVCECPLHIPESLRKLCDRNWRDAEIWQTEVNIGLMVRNLPKSCIILFQLLVHVTQILEQLLFGVRVAPTFWCDKRGHTAVKSNFPTLERGPSQEHMNAALYLGYMASHGYHSISRVYREIYDVYLNILKSPQEHFINARM